ncbi:conserved hypothetical protein [Bacillus sp. IT-79MI2]
MARFVVGLDLMLVLVVKRVYPGMVDTFVVADMELVELRKDSVGTEFPDLVVLRMDFDGVEFHEVAELYMDFDGIELLEFVVLSMNSVDIEILVVVVLVLQNAALDIVVLDFEDSMVALDKSIYYCRTFLFPPS